MQFASAIGSFKTNQCAISGTEAAAAAMHTALKGMVSAESLDAASGDASAKNTSTQGKLPHTSEPIVAISAKAGLAIVAGQDAVMSAGETILMGAGQDANLATGGAMRIHSGQAIGVLAGAISAGTEASGKGITLIAGKGAIEVQAQADTLQVAAKGDVSIQSKSEHIDWAAAKKIVLQTKGGASITIEGGNITVQCPGTITVKAGTKSFIGPEKASYAIPELPHKPIESIPVKFNMLLNDVPGPHGVPLPNTQWRVVQARDEAAALSSEVHVLEGQTDDAGSLKLSATDEEDLHKAWNQRPGQLWIVAEGHVHELVLTVDRSEWTDDQKLNHAMDAMGYSDDYGVTANDTSDVTHTSLARRETKAKTGAALLRKI